MKAVVTFVHHCQGLIILHGRPVIIFCDYSSQIDKHGCRILFRIMKYHHVVFTVSPLY